MTHFCYYPRKRERSFEKMLYMFFFITKPCFRHFQLLLQKTCSSSVKSQSFILYLFDIPPLDITLFNSILSIQHYLEKCKKKIIDIYFSQEYTFLLVIPCTACSSVLSWTEMYYQSFILKNLILAIRKIDCLFRSLIKQN